MPFYILFLFLFYLNFEPSCCVFPDVFQLIILKKLGKNSTFLNIYVL